MLRVARVNVLVFLFMLMGVQTARADIWDWLEDLSGPGPFHTRGNLSGTFYCSKDKPDPNRPELGGWFRPLGRDSRKYACFYADVRRFRSDADLRFQETSMDFYESGTMLRPIKDIPAIEIGAGVGFVHMDSGGLTSTRFTISFPKVALKPFLLIPKLQQRENRDQYGFIQLYFRETRTVHGFSPSNFSTQPGFTYAPPSNGEVLKSFGFIVDATLLGHAISHGFK